MGNSLLEDFRINIAERFASRKEKGLNKLLKSLIPEVVGTALMFTSQLAHQM
jgi:hypothetical protein